MRRSRSLGLVASLMSLSACAAEEDPGTLDPPLGGGAATARVRVAHLSPDAPPVDFCLSPAGTRDFAGPVLKSLGAADGISYANVTAYVDVKPIQYDVRIVAPNADDCATSLGGLPDFTKLPALPEGATATIAALGHVNAGGDLGFRLAAYIDDTEVTFGKAKLRFLHASPGTPPVDVGLGGGVLFAPVFPNIPYGSGLPTNNGYLETAPLAHREISARASGTTTDVISVKPADLPAGAIATAFAIGELTNPSRPLDVLVCVDNAPPKGILSVCAKAGSAPERARVRVAHLSPDAPPVDVCLAEAGTQAWGAPLLRSLGGAAGLMYPQVTTYVELPVQKYDVRVILASATGCGAGAVPDTNGVEVTAGLTATVAAIGVIDRSGGIPDPDFRLQVLADDTTVTAGRTKLRFFHASPGTAAVDVGTGSGFSFQAVFQHIAFGTTASDNNGYVERHPVTTTISARVSGTHIDALVIPSVTLAADQIATAIAIGGKTNTHTNPLRVLLCIDSAPPNGLLSKCVVAP